MRSIIRIIFNSNYFEMTTENFFLSKTKYRLKYIDYRLKTDCFR